jgi:hypothetical protein
LKNEEPNSLVGMTRTMLLKSGWAARGCRPGMGLLAPSSRVLTVMLKNISANACSYREGAAMNNDDARTRKPWSQSALAHLDNIVSSLQYCPKVLISARRGRNRSSFFFGISWVTRAALPDRSEAQGWVRRLAELHRTVTHNYIHAALHRFFVNDGVRGNMGRTLE